MAEYVPEFRLVRPIGRRGHSGDLGQSSFDGVDEGVVGDYPVKWPGVGLCQEDWCGGHVDDVLQKSGISYLPDSLEPLGILGQCVPLAGVSPVAVVALIVDDQNGSLLGFPVCYPVHHVPWGFPFSPPVPQELSGRSLPQLAAAAWCWSAPCPWVASGGS